MLTPLAMEPSIRARLVHAYIRWQFRDRSLLEMDPVDLRALVERLSLPPMAQKSLIRPVKRPDTSLPAGTPKNFAHLHAPVDGEWHFPNRVSAEHTRMQKAILYFHGGGYVFGSPRTHRAMTLGVAAEAQLPVFSLDYALAPEHPFPAALDDAFRAWTWLTQTLSISPAAIAIGGDSAGAGLALALMHKLRANDLAGPACVFLLSPYADLTMSAPSVGENASTDHMFTEDTIRRAPDFYCAPAQRRDPLVSPLFGCFDGFAPTLIFASEDEMLRDDATRLHTTLERAGAPSTLILRSGMVHVWPVFHMVIPEGKKDLRSIAEFIRTHINI
ncbi:MAG: alpha/beta hydrolase [Pseudomonadota bacterium]